MFSLNSNPVWLTSHEKKVLHLLIDNCQMNDTDIAMNLDISSQAVGKIRKKLEEEGVIKSYNLDLDLQKLGITLTFLLKLELTPEGKKLTKNKIMEAFINCPEIVNAFEVLGSNFTHIINARFKNMEDFNSFMHSKENHENFHKYFKTIETYPIPLSNICKNDTRALFHKLIESI